MARQYVSGTRELIWKLSSLEGKVAKKILGKANSKAIRPVITAAKRGARQTSNTLAKGIGLRHARYKAGQIHTVVVGVRNLASVASIKPKTHFLTGGWSMRKHDPRHTAHLVERGTAPHMIPIPKLKVTVRHPGTKAKPFLEPALVENVNAVIRKHKDTLRSEILIAVK